MPYDPNRHHRRSIRLKGYDYTQPGAYFVTLCHHERMPLFGEIVNGEMRLNDIGRVAERCWLDIPSDFPHVALDAFVIMPNHVHGILWIIESPPNGGNAGNGNGRGEKFLPLPLPPPSSTEHPRGHPKPLGPLTDSKSASKMGAAKPTSTSSGNAIITTASSATNAP
jgi:putative transposase